MIVSYKHKILDKNNLINKKLLKSHNLIFTVKYVEMKLRPLYREVAEIVV